MKCRQVGGLVNELHLAHVARLCLWCLVGISESYAQAQLISFAEVELLKNRGALWIVVDDSHRTAETYRAYAERCGREHDVLRHQSAVVCGEIVSLVACYEHHYGCVAEAAGNLLCLFVGIGLCHDVFYLCHDLRLVHHSHLPRLLVLSVGSVDAAFHYLGEYLAVYCLVLILAYAASRHDIVYDGIVFCHDCGVCCRRLCGVAVRSLVA